MKAQPLVNKKVAILATDGFEKSELFEPKKALEAAGAEVEIVSLKEGQIKSWDKKNWGEAIDVDVILKDATAENYAALVLPGGVMNPDALRIHDDAIQFIQKFTDAHKPIGAICHGPWTLIEANFVDGKKMTSWPSLQTDLKNAGAEWVNEQVVVDDNLVTSRKPDDLPAFNEKLIELIATAGPFIPAQKEAKIRAAPLSH